MNKAKLRTSLRIKIIIFIATTILIVLMFPQGESLVSDTSIGTIWIQDDLITPFSFPIIKNKKTYQYELNAARESVSQIFQIDKELVICNLDSLKTYNKFLLETIDSDINANGINYSNQTALSAYSYNVLKELRKKEKLSPKQSILPLILNKIESHLSMLYSTGILDLSYNQILKDSITIRDGIVDVNEPKTKYFDYEKSRNVLWNYLQKDKLSEPELNALFEYAVRFIIPDIKYNAKLTQEEISIAQNKVSKYTGIVNENERIIAKHDRITPDIKQKIDSYRIAKGENATTLETILRKLGKFFHIFSLLLLLSIYIFLFRKKIFNDNLKLLLFSILFLWTCFITFFINQLTIDDSFRLLIFIPTVSMLITIIFDSRIGFYTTVIISLITGALRGNDYSFVIMNIVAGALSVYTVRDIKNRTQIFRSFLYILIGYTITILAFGLERLDSPQKIITEFAFAGTNALISPVLTYGFLIFFEKIFNITTDLTFLDLSDFERPLLREMAKTARGTFNHSLLLGNLSESASEVIGAHPLLARVGAYYHDIGKLISPQFFVENQHGEINPHELIKPEESVKIINNHVQKGIELGKENKLPEEIIDFIPMHHGTTVMSFFYEKAKKLYGEENVDINNYRYPGPKPNTKETAVVMLADTCESAVRSIENPDNEKVENLISNLIDKRIEDGQLDESPLTINDIKKIKTTFTNILIGQYHKRIRYPEQDEMEKQSE
jgi:hypothetical protein